MFSLVSGSHANSDASDSKVNDFESDSDRSESRELVESRAAKPKPKDSPPKVISVPQHKLKRARKKVLKVYNSLNEEEHRTDQDANLKGWRKTAKDVVFNSKRSEKLATAMTPSLSYQNRKFFRSLLTKADAANVRNFPVHIICNAMHQALFDDGKTPIQIDTESLNVILLDFLNCIQYFAMKSAFLQTGERELTIVNEFLANRPKLGGMYKAMRELSGEFNTLKDSNSNSAQEVEDEADHDHGDVPDRNNPRIKALCYRKWQGECTRGKNCRFDHICIFCRTRNHQGNKCTGKGLAIAKISELNTKKVKGNSVPAVFPRKKRK